MEGILKNDKKLKLNKKFYENIIKMESYNEEQKKLIEDSIYILSTFIESTNNDYQYNSTYLSSYIEPLIDFLDSVNIKKQQLVEVYKKISKKRGQELIQLFNISEEGLLIEIIVDDFWYYNSNDNDITWTGRININKIKSQVIFLECNISKDNVTTYFNEKISSNLIENNLKKVEGFVKKIEELVLMKEAIEIDDK